MSNLFFLDPISFNGSLYPFTLTRAGIDIPLGICTLREKWSALLTSNRSNKGNQICTLSSAILPEPTLAKKIQTLKPGQSMFTRAGQWIATAAQIDYVPLKVSKTDLVVDDLVGSILFPWDLLTHLESGMALDFSLLTKGKKSQPIPKQVTRIGKHPIFIAKGARLLPCVLNSSAGPIFIGEHAEVQEGAFIRGPFMLGGDSVVKMGAKIYGPTAAGAKCVLGGEIKRSLIFPYSNKAHDGYMGDSVIGSWCNWGAGTSNSNVKNTAGIIRVEWNGKRVAVGQKLGVFMGDHTRTAINTSINSGTIMGVSVQVSNDRLTEKRIPSFRWMDGKKYRFELAMEHIRQWKSMKGGLLLPAEIDQLKKIYKTDK